MHVGRRICDEGVFDKTMHVDKGLPDSRVFSLCMLAESSATRE